MTQPKLRDFRDLIGVPFMWGGRNPALGLDCWGLVMEIQRRFGHEIPDVDIACAQALRIHRAAQAQIRALWQPVPAAAPGVVAVMATDHAHPNVIQHFGVCLDANNILHSQQDTGAVLDRLDILASVLCIKGLYQWRG